MDRTKRQILPRATKTSLVKLLRARGYDVPSIQAASFDQDRRIGYFFLHWYDKGGVRHYAHYFSALGMPMLLVDTEYTDLSMAEVIRFGLYREKKIPHDCEGSHTGSVLREYNKDIFILAQENEFGKGVRG